ncbi:methyltransferase domain-containing protein [Streptomyces sp. LX-29]|uniref:methyltransferase domain-containing protein n=1 Tax=Streptomyces sp. LX-29 TaxID=2900152 RepID=UPI00240E16FF|nr:methyltransferase domain-containing protein [Streptomyces sp. LX-29]WFB08552.1 methyltransferase domain-containing protein [Streptomyces sp. LX-29]
MSDDPARDEIRPYLSALVDGLRAAGALRTPQWADAFGKVPRHLFVPQWYRQGTDEKGIAVWERADTSDRAAWLSAVYSDQTLVTALDPVTAAQVDDRAWTGVPTSSSTMPGLMAGMLEDLGVEDGHRVLEIGTGTGYNAALLSARLGAGLVHSVDVAPDLVEAARGRLAQIGYTPHLAAADGRDGYPDQTSFDRTIATCSVPGIPSAWVEQSRTGGVILADIALGIEGGLVRVTVDEERRAVGCYTATGGRFMAARGDALAYPHQAHAPQVAETGTRPTTVTAADIRSHYPFRLLLAFHLPSAELVYHADDDGTVALQIQQPDGSWARTPLAGPATVTYGGPPELWQQVEDAWTWWNAHDRPAQDQFGYRRDPDGSHHAWHTTTGRRWLL